MPLLLQSLAAIKSIRHGSYLFLTSGRDERTDPVWKFYLAGKIAPFSTSAEQAWGIQPDVRTCHQRSPRARCLLTSLPTHSQYVNMHMYRPCLNLGMHCRVSIQWRVNLPLETRQFGDWCRLDGQGPRGIGQIVDKSSHVSR